MAITGSITKLCLMWAKEIVLQFVCLSFDEI